MRTRHYIEFSARHAQVPDCPSVPLKHRSEYYPHNEKEPLFNETPVVMFRYIMNKPPKEIYYTSYAQTSLNLFRPALEYKHWRELKKRDCYIL